jgi:DNA-binding transcriptional MerR regulator/effector-binding domain-containing protein
MLSIGQFSRLCRISIKALRHYDEVGLLKPAQVDEASGYRYYTLEQAEVAERIRLFRSLDMPLDEIRGLLAEQDPRAGRERMERHLRWIEDQLAERREMLSTLKVLLYGAGGAPPSIGLRNVEPTRIVGRSARAAFHDRGKAVSRSLLEIYGALGELCVPPVGPPTATFMDCEDEEDDLLVEVAVPIGEAVDVRPPLHAGTLPGGLAASIVHQGGYGGLAHTHRALLSWMLEEGYQAGGPLREIYIRGPGATTDPSEYRTELLLPICGSSPRTGREET